MLKETPKRSYLVIIIKAEIEFLSLKQKSSMILDLIN